MAGLGPTLVAAGSAALLVVALQFVISDRLADRRQAHLSDRLAAEWAEDPTVNVNDPNGAASELPLGSPIAVLYIPRLGADYRRVVVEGTGEAQLAQGPGHYPATALPGQRGNVALAGHRVGDGSPFLDLDRLRPGDAVVLETADDRFVYRVLGDPRTGDVVDPATGIPGRHVVSPEAVEVIAPTPNRPRAAPTGAYLTLTTCHPRFSARQRLVVHAALEGTGTSETSDPDGSGELLDR